MARLQIIAVSLAACLLLVVSEQDGHAQVRRYQPATPTISPYLNLTRNNFNGLPNYYSLVRPQLQQQAFNRQELSVLAGQSAEIGLLQSGLEQSVTPTGKHSGFMTMGRAGYMNTTRYYPQRPVAPRR